MSTESCFRRGTSSLHSVDQSGNLQERRGRRSRSCSFATFGNTMIHVCSMGCVSQWRILHGFEAYPSIYKPGISSLLRLITKGQGTMFRRLLPVVVKAIISFRFPATIHKLSKDLLYQSEHSFPLFPIVSHRVISKAIVSHRFSQT